MLGLVSWYPILGIPSHTRFTTQTTPVVCHKHAHEDPDGGKRSSSRFPPAGPGIGPIACCATNTNTGTRTFCMAARSRKEAWQGKSINDVEYDEDDDDNNDGVKLARVWDDHIFLGYRKNR